MGGYGYRYQSYSTFTTMGSRTDDAFGPVTRSLVFPNSKVSSEDHYDNDYVPKKTLVPVATGPYDDDCKHGSPTNAYPARHDDEWHRQTSPVHVYGRPERGDELLTKGTMLPVATRPYDGDEYKHSSPTKRYHASNDDEWHRPYRNDELLTKRTGVPVVSRPNGGDEYKHGSPIKAYPVGDDDKRHRQKADELLTKRTMVPGCEYERSSPTTEADPARHDIDHKWHRPQKPQANPPVIWTDWRRSSRSTAYNGNEEGPEGSSKPVVSQHWSSVPRNGTQLSEATDDIDKAAELFVQAKRLVHTSEGDHRGHKHIANNAFPIPNKNDSHGRRNVVADRPTPTPTPSSNHALDNPIDARRRSATIDSREAEKKYNGKRV